MTQAAPSTTADTPTLPPWHALGVDEAIALTQTRPEGLATADGAMRLKTHGPNLATIADMSSIDWTGLFSRPRLRIAAPRTGPAARGDTSMSKLKQPRDNHPRLHAGGEASDVRHHSDRPATSETVQRLNARPHAVVRSPPHHRQR